MNKSVRIKYTKHSFGYSEYSVDILAGNKVVVINVTDDGKYVIVEKGSHAVLKIQQCKDLTDAKRCARVYIRSIGANLYDEIRQRKFKA